MNAPVGFRFFQEGPPLKEVCEYRFFMGWAELQKSLNTLIGLLKGIAIDGEVNMLELAEVQNWYQLHRHLIDKNPYDELLPTLNLALEDNLLSPEEIEDLIWLCENLIKTYGNPNGKATPYFDLVTSKIQQLHGLLHAEIADNKLNDRELDRLSCRLQIPGDTKGRRIFQGKNRSID